MAEGRARGSLFRISLFGSTNIFPWSVKGTASQKWSLRSEAVTVINFAGYSSSECRFCPKSVFTFHMDSLRPCLANGVMDNASDFGSEDCRFQSHLARAHVTCCISVSDLFGDARITFVRF
ncbi:hypothetical protein chiPu_0032875 [Chiloscyllium punctatum]|uniref:Uncharacterized protein n=1 Tax=Chiloscyllium punctatum TaxID=137246 RepID=A0A401U0P0_CHIPU|nr:hypothetical protein [Chiloscyllium punctatum]